MVLECVLVDIVKDANGNPILDANGDLELENYQFKFKNTYKNNKEIIINAGKLNKQQ